MQATPEDISNLIKLQQADMALIKARKQFDELPQREQIRAARASLLEREGVPDADGLSAKLASLRKEIADREEESALLSGSLQKEEAAFAAAKLLEFEHAAYLRDKIKELEGSGPLPGQKRRLPKP